MYANLLLYLNFLPNMPYKYLLFILFICSISWAQEIDSVFPQAENIDLKEVSTEPLRTPEPELEDVTPPADEENPPLLDENSDSVKPAVGSNSIEDENTEGIELSDQVQDSLEDADQAQQSLFLLKNEVPPGMSTRLGWSPSVAFLGISQPTAVLVLNGAEPGPTLCVTAAVHGDELNGIEIVRRLMYNIDPDELRGAVIGVPIVNLQGFRRSSRYLTDRRDLNRFFPGNPDGSSAARIAHSFFSEVITHCDKLIDLHTGSFRRTNLPQIRADLSYSEVADLAKKMGAIVVLQSEGAEGSLRRAAVEQGIAAVTLEAGAPHQLDKDAVDYGVKSIEHAMDALDMIDRRRFWERTAEPIYYQSAWVRARKGGILFSDVKLGSRVSKGDLLGTVTDPITNESSLIEAPFDGMVIGMALDQVMFPGFAAYHIGLQSSANEVVNKNPIVAMEETTMPVSSETEEMLNEGSDEFAPPESQQKNDQMEADLIPIEDSE